MTGRIFWTVIAIFHYLSPLFAADADLIFHNGKIVTVDKQFSIHQAIAVKDERILKVGTAEEVLKTKGDKTQLLDLQGKMVLPGLIDSHVHPTSACMTEFDHPLPEMETVADVLEYIKGRAKVLAEGEWIQLRQVFITRLKEQRYPTRDELDQAAPKNPVLFATGPDAALNSLALKLSNIDKDFKVTDGGAGFVEKDPTTGELTGILRNCTRYVKVQSTGRQATDLDRAERLIQLFKDYNSVGLTGIIDRDASPAAILQYEKLKNKNHLSLRIAVSHHVDTSGAGEKIVQSIHEVADHPLRVPDPWLQIIGIKTYLDGGMLTGSAYMQAPWGVSKIYGIADPEYRGLLFIPKDKLLGIVYATVKSNLQFTAHSVGDGAVHTLLDVYRELAQKMDIRKTRPCLTHANFMSDTGIKRMSQLGIVVDIQPAWLYLDTRTLDAQFGYDRLRYFQPLKSLFQFKVLAGGGSDHMQKIGSFRSVNPYNPFLGMQTTITRKARGYEKQLHPEEALTREQAIQFYTINNAHLMFREKDLGSLEPGKLADLVVVDRDLLTCPEETIKDTQVERTYVGGKVVYAKR
ncbi:MAG TPA: amidohydrolase [Gemmataceae bacterium]|nr:amidohydrolase [Gemmataceae bacterium]